MLYVADKSTRTVIVKCLGVTEGVKIIKDFEKDDKNFGVYTPGYYQIIDENGQEVY